MPGPHIHPRQVGTFVVDGMLEGPTAHDPDLGRKLSDWVRLARTAGYGFSLEMEGTSFNLLGENRPTRVPAHITEVSEPLRDLLQQLLDAFPQPEKAAVFSTVRTLSYADGTETQSLYVIEPGGVVDVRQRVVDAVTVAGEKPLTGREKIRAAILALLVLAALFGISSLFVDYRALATSTLRKIVPVDTDAIGFVPGPYEGFLKRQSLETADQGRVLVLTLARTDAFPKDLAEIDRRLESQELSSAERRTLESLAAGYLRIELIGPDDAYQATASARITDLRKTDVVAVRLRFSREDPPERLVLTW